MGVGAPIFVSLSGLNQGRRGALDIERIGNGKFCQREISRVWIGVDNSGEQQAGRFHDDPSQTSLAAVMNNTRSRLATVPINSSYLSFFCRVAVRRIVARPLFRIRFRSRQCALAVDCNPDSTRVFNSVVEVEATDVVAVLLGLLLFPYKIVDFARPDPTSLSRPRSRSRGSSAFFSLSALSPEFMAAIAEERNGAWPRASTSSR